MHKKLSTEGLVLGKRGQGEADTSVVLFTKDFGLVRAVARSARREHSKLRYGLEPLTVARFSLIRGKLQWRLVGTDDISRTLLAAPAAHRHALGRISRLLLRLIHGEEINVALYSDVVEGFSSLANTHSEADAASIECITVLRILSQLGYLSNTKEVAHFLEGDLSSLELASKAALQRASLVRLINDSLSASGL
jgi:DNA repair protein RecO